MLINGNYLTASLIALGFILLKYGFHYSIEQFCLALCLEFYVAGTFVIYSKAISLAGTALATVSARLSVLIPVLLSIMLLVKAQTLK